MKGNLNKLKGLKEKRNSKLIELDSLTGRAMEEERAFTEEEKNKFNELEEEVRALGDTIKACEKEYERDIEELPPDEKKEVREEEAEERAFVNYIRNVEIDEELRADSNWTVGDNGAVIPSRIANKILEKVKDRCAIYSYATKYNLGGTLNFPVYDEDNGSITMTYADEFETLNATSGKFTSVSLTGFLAAALTKVSRSLINNSKFDLFSFVVNKMAEKIADFLEKELLKGTEDKIEGLSTVDVVATALTADSLIDLQDSVKGAFQHNARWIMSPGTKNKIRKFKDGQGNYLLERDYTTGNGSWSLLGKPVDITDEMADDDIFYGDFSGLAVKITENPNMQVLREMYATEHAVGVVAWLEIDAKVLEKQKIKRLTVA